MFATSGPATAISAAFTPAPAPGTYPFPTQDFFASATGVFNGSYRLTLSDFLLDPSGVNTVAGINDLLGTVRVTPGADVSGPIQISFDPSSLQLDDSAGRPIDATFPNPVIAQETKVNQTPAPAGVALAFSGGVMFIVRKRVSSANCHARNTRA